MKKHSKKNKGDPTKELKGILKGVKKTSVQIQHEIEQLYHLKQIARNSEKKD
ncbi:hypothetical protein HZC09_02655 [Candidatus Micrarchaeota archaeon]|nr:hypothetical protein [Candidatus Micrarchaeota archaeon]